MELIETGITITLDRERRLIFDVAAHKELSKATGKNTLAPEFWSDTLEKMDPELLEKVLWAGLLRDDPRVTLEKVSDIIGAMNPILLRRAITDSLRSALIQAGIAKEDDAEPDPMKANAAVV